MDKAGIEIIARDLLNQPNSSDLLRRLLEIKDMTYEEWIANPIESKSNEKSDTSSS